MIRVRHPFRVVSIEPRLAFAGSARACDTGGRAVRLEAGLGVGYVEVVLGAEQAKALTVGKIVTVEIIGPDPMGELYGLEVGPPGTLIESEQVRALVFESAKRFRSALAEVPGRAVMRMSLPVGLTPRESSAVEEVIAEEIKKAIAGVLR